MPNDQATDADAMNAVTLGVDVIGGRLSEELSIAIAETASDALRLVRLLDAELLVTAARLPNAEPLQMIRRLRIARPWQQWALATDVLSNAAEIEARSLGVTAIFGARPDVESLLAIASAIRRARLRQGPVQRTGPRATRNEPATRVMSPK